MEEMLVCPDALLQQRMLEEERAFLAFLASMQPGLQHAQMLAVRSAMQGNGLELQRIRES